MFEGSSVFCNKKALGCIISELVHARALQCSGLHHDTNEVQQDEEERAFFLHGGLRQSAKSVLAREGIIEEVTFFMEVCVVLVLHFAFF